MRRRHVGIIQHRTSLPRSAWSEADALAWLYGLSDQERGVGWNPAANPSEQWKLGRTRALLDVAGAPDHNLCCVLVGGTKGKGSTAALLASIGLKHSRRRWPKSASFRK